MQSLGIDSLGVAELLLNFEDEFHITLSPDTVQLLNLGDVVRFIDELVDVHHGHKTENDEHKAAGMTTP